MDRNSPNPNAKTREKIQVAVRIRPLSSREISQRETSAWDCVDSRTIVQRPAPTPPTPERSPHHHSQQSKSYTFDHVFGPESATEQVYEEGAKDIALSALCGVNATIFAYGQTSSGKTFTMRGVTQNTIRDIFNYIEKHSERNFVIKISAIEIYNEVVKDLLNTDTNIGPLRLMDDPEKGTIVERLVEDIVRDKNHFQQILSVIEAQRQVGETSLNETSSRSHQIIRLTIESFPRVADGGLVKSLVANLNLVDLAGSERASQTHSEGTRLKEGCHINRSLLTLTNIIRKLSGPSREKAAHLPYRDSKLTRILQNSLGGNARTAIICTMSPAQTHMEQSRNTLFFATQAKEVTNSAQVNMVVSDKDMVKLLQKEVARLETELRVTDSSETQALLKKKDAEIQQLREEVKELHYQRDLAQAELDALRKRLAQVEGSKEMDGFILPTPTLLSPRSTNGFGKQLTDIKTSKQRQSTARQSSRASMMLIQEIRKLEQLQQELGQDANTALEALQKEAECLRLAQSDMNHDAASTISKLQDEIQALKLGDAKEKPLPQIRETQSSTLREEILRLQGMADDDGCITDTTIANLEEKLDIVQKSINNMVLDSSLQFDTESPSKTKTPNSVRKQSNLSQGSARRSLGFENNENNPPNCRTPNKKQGQINKEDGSLSKENTPNSKKNNSVDIRKMQQMFKTAAEENIRSIRAYVTDLKERVAKLQYQKQLLVHQVLELEANADQEIDMEDVSEDGSPFPPVPDSRENWQLLFQKERMQIAQLWDLCHVSIIHRSQFYLMFKGDPADQVYMEVELRRLAWLQEHFDAELAANPFADMDEDGETSVAASIRALKKEREQIAKRMRTGLTEDEKEAMYQRWGVPLGAKQRKLQVAYRVWTNPHDEVHIRDSAELVGRVMGFWTPGKETSKELFELTYAPPSNRKPWLQVGWNALINNLNALNI
uniref:Kinesin 7-IId protein n=1 Tax=Marsilea vestita TaxID=59764 RepID=A0A142KWA5_MARVE|nr:kinesin 7-IId protein [Marsilea vestita]